MTIKTMDEYRTRISKKTKRPSSSLTTEEIKYFRAGFTGAAMAARAQERKADKPSKGDGK